MGRCHEFGTQIRQGCQHPMRPGTTSCGCNECGVVCGGQFDGCADVWSRGNTPVTVTLRPPPASLEALGEAGAGDQWESRSLFVPNTQFPLATRASSMPPGLGGASSMPPGVRSPASTSLAGRPGPAAEGPTQPPVPPGAGGPTPTTGRPLIGRNPVYDAAGPRLATPGGSGPRASAVEAVARLALIPRPAVTPKPPQADTSATNRELAAPSARVQLFKWFESEFSLLRNEVADVAQGLTHQRAMLAEFSEERNAQLRLALVAESLPGAVDDAVQAAVGQHIAKVVTDAGTVTKAVTAVVDDVVGLADKVQQATDRTETIAESMQESMQAAEAQAAERRDDIELLDSALGSLRQQVMDLSTAIVSQQQHLAAELPKLQAMRATITRQLKPLNETLPAAVAEAVTAVVDNYQVASQKRWEEIARDMRAAVTVEVAEANHAHRQAAEALTAEVQALRLSLARQLRPLSAMVERNRDNATDPKPPRTPPKKRAPTSPPAL